MFFYFSVALPMALYRYVYDYDYDYDYDCYAPVFVKPRYTLATKSTVSATFDFVASVYRALGALQ